VLAALPTAISGLADWSDYFGAERRVGFVHAVGNVAALTCYSLSWVARRNGKRQRGVVLGLAGATLATLSAYLGGHLAWRQGVNIDRHAWDHVSDEWFDVAAEDEVADGKPMAVAAGGDTVLLYRDGGVLHAISDVCSHAGGPLNEGAFEGGCVKCPWHGSVFRLDDGSVVHGPATGPQPAYDVRMAEGRVSVRRR
jgi:nitrite reductase/ring-hydroxylating ferredoxin subunit